MKNVVYTAFVVLGQVVTLSLNTTAPLNKGNTSLEKTTAFSVDHKSACFRPVGHSTWAVV